jgi:hypothetical protein
MAVNKSPGRPFQPGQSGNPDGRPPGARNRRTQEIWDKLEAQGSTDPAEFLAPVVDDPKADASLRVNAANALMPYKYSKRGLSSEPPPLVYVVGTVELPHTHATCVAHTLENIEHVSQLRRIGKLDQDTADRLVAEQRIIRDGLIEEAKLLMAQGGPPEQTIRISGGLPDLPLGPGDGPVIMPEIARAALHPAVVNGAAVREGTILPPVPVIPHPESPLAEKPGPPEPPLAKPRDDRS